MQFNCPDYFKEPSDTGCCLDCSNSYKGCSCYECKCKKCYWYNWEGFCEFVDILEERKRKEFIETKNAESELKYNRKALLKAEVKKQIDKKDFENPPNIYSCQKCGNDFIMTDDIKIIKNKQPLCKFCREGLS